MRGILIGLALTLAALPAWTQPHDETMCQSFDPDTSISGCTALIQSAQVTTQHRADGVVRQLHSTSGPLARRMKRLPATQKKKVEKNTPFDGLKFSILSKTDTQAWVRVTFLNWGTPVEIVLNLREDGSWVVGDSGFLLSNILQ